MSYSDQFCLLNGLPLKDLDGEKVRKAPEVQSFDSLPHLSAFRASLVKSLGPKAEGLCAEGNHCPLAASQLGLLEGRTRGVGQLN